VDRYSESLSEFRHPNVRGLKYADKDAISFYDYLRSPYGGAVEYDRLKLLVNERATEAEILKAVKERTNFTSSDTTPTRRTS